MTRKDLVESLRVLHEHDEITQIKQTKKRIEVHFVTNLGTNLENMKLRIGLLVIPYHQHDNNSKTKRLPKHVRDANDAMDAANKTHTT